MTRAAREERAAAAARRGEQTWATQAYLNLLGLTDQMPQAHPTRGVLERFLRQAPPTIKAAATLIVAERAGTEPVDIDREGSR